MVAGSAAVEGCEIEAGAVAVDECCGGGVSGRAVLPCGEARLFVNLGHQPLANSTPERSSIKRENSFFLIHAQSYGVRQIIEVDNKHTLGARAHGGGKPRSIRTRDRIAGYVSEIDGGRQATWVCHSSEILHEVGSIGILGFYSLSGHRSATVAWV